MWELVAPHVGLAGRTCLLGATACYRDLPKWYSSLHCD